MAPMSLPNLSITLSFNPDSTARFTLTPNAVRQVPSPCKVNLVRVAFRVGDPLTHSVFGILTFAAARKLARNRFPVRDCQPSTPPV